MLGRAQLDYTSNQQISYNETLLQVVNNELGLHDLPIVTNMDFGHTDPMFVIPLGCQAELNCDTQKFSIIENACA